jgi:type IV secretory pathway VirB4 component
VSELAVISTHIKKLHEEVSDIKSSLANAGLLVQKQQIKQEQPAQAD